MVVVRVVLFLRYESYNEVRDMSPKTLLKLAGILKNRMR